MKLTMRIRLLNEYVKLVRLSWHDMIRYAKHACIGWNRGDYDEGQLEGRMIANYHVVEKGLSMPDFRPRFGAPTVKKLISLIQEGEQKFKWCQNVNYLTAVLALRSLLRGWPSRRAGLAPHQKQPSRKSFLASSSNLVKHDI